MSSSEILWRRLSQGRRNYQSTKVQKCDPQSAKVDFCSVESRLPTTRDARHTRSNSLLQFPVTALEKYPKRKSHKVGAMSRRRPAGRRTASRAATAGNPATGRSATGPLRRLPRRHGAGRPAAGRRRAGGDGGRALPWHFCTFWSQTQFRVTAIGWYKRQNSGGGARR